MGRRRDSRRGRSDAEAREAFERIYRATYRDIQAYCRRRLANPADADDVVADTYLVAWRRIDDLLRTDAPLAWLYGVSFRTLANQRRSLDRAGNLAIKLASVAAEAASPDPGEIVVYRSDLEAVVRALGSLAERDQELLTLVAWEQLSHPEIAVALDMPRALVRSWVYRARARLLAAIDREEGRT